MSRPCNCHLPASEVERILVIVQAECGRSIFVPVSFIAARAMTSHLAVTIALNHRDEDHE